MLCTAGAMPPLHLPCCIPRLCGPAMAAGSRLNLLWENSKRRAQGDAIPPGLRCTRDVVFPMGDCRQEGDAKLVPTVPCGRGRGGGAGPLMGQWEKILQESQVRAWEKPVFLSDLETIQICFCSQFKNILLPRSIILSPLHGLCCAQGGAKSRSRVSGCAQGNERQAPAPLWGGH